MFRLPLLVTLVLAACAVLPAQNCSVTPYGQGCGPVATGVVNPVGGTMRFDFTVTAAPRSRVLLVVGVNETATPLPFTSCLLLTELAFTQQHRTDAAGQWSFSHAIAGGGSFTGYARIQFIQFDIDSNGGLSLSPSNGLLMDCGGGS